MTEQTITQEEAELLFKGGKMEQTQNTTNLTITAPTGLEAKTQTGEVEVRKGTVMLVAELAKLVRKTFESKDCRFRSDWNGDDCLEYDSDIDITSINGELLAYISTEDKETPFVHERNYSPIYINAHTPMGLERAKVFAKSYKELTGQNAVIYQQFDPEALTSKEQPIVLEETVEEPTKPARNEVKFRGGMKPQPKPKESSGFLRGFYTATAGELAAKAILMLLPAVGGYFLSECRHPTNTEPPAQVRTQEQDQTVRAIVEDVKSYNPNAVD